MIRKAKPSKAKKQKGLELRVPNDIALIDLANDGLLVPTKLTDREGYAPLDFTSISSREVGQQHSYWSVRHSHLLYLVGNLRASLGNIKYDLKNTEASWMVKHKGEYKNKWEAEHAMRRNKKIKRLRGEVVRVESALTRYEALSEAYAGLRNAASREIARRSEERTAKD